MDQDQIEELMGEVEDQLEGLYEAVYTSERQAELALRSLFARFRARLSAMHECPPHRLADMIQEECAALAQRMPPDRSPDEIVERMGPYMARLMERG